MTNVNQKFFLINFLLEDLHIDVTVKDEATQAVHMISRVDFEHWLTDGTGQLVWHANAPVPRKAVKTVDLTPCTMADYWNYAKENPEGALQDLQDFLTRTPSTELDVVVTLRLQGVIDAVGKCGLKPNNYQVYMIKSAVVDYGAARGMWSASSNYDSLYQR